MDGSSRCPTAIVFSGAGAARLADAAADDGDSEVDAASPAVTPTGASAGVVSGVCAVAGRAANNASSRAGSIVVRASVRVRGTDRKSIVVGKGGSVRVNLRGRR